MCLETIKDFFFSIGKKNVSFKKYVLYYVGHITLIKQRKKYPPCALRLKSIGKNQHQFLLFVKYKTRFTAKQKQTSALQLCEKSKLWLLELSAETFVVSFQT